MIKIINPASITDYNRTPEEMEIFLVFAIFVAGRRSDVMARKVNEMFGDKCVPSSKPDKVLPSMVEASRLFHWALHDQGMSPLGAINYLKQESLLQSLLGYHKIGQYSRIGKCLAEISSVRGGLHLISNTTVKELEKYSGIGPKTARFFMLHNFGSMRLAVLDTHILSWMAELVEDHLNRPRGTVPTATPQSPSTYEFWELVWLGHCYKHHVDPAKHDLELWNERS